MRRLSKNQVVRVDLDGNDIEWEAHSLECRVRSIQGPVATLTPVATVPAATHERLAAGSMCFMTFEYNRAPVALRGAILATAGGVDLEFVVVDGIQVAERRSAERTRMVAAVRAVPLGPPDLSAEPVSTVTSNLSMGGALLLRRPGLGDGTRWRIELFLPSDPDPVVCEAELARSTPTHFGVRFLNVSERDQLRVAGVLAGAQRRLAAPAPA